MGFLGDGRSARGYAEDYARIRKNVNRNAWDGDWYVSYIGEGRAAVRIETERRGADLSLHPGVGR